jgi:hypothetical protein
MVDTLMLYAFAPLSSHLRVFVSSWRKKSFRK